MRTSDSVSQAHFVAALLDPKSPVPSGLVGPDGQSSIRRFNVYRNNVVAGLVRVLRDFFPATARLVGEEFFLLMARTFITGELPASPLLFEYGGNFPNFIRRFEPAGALPYLPDIARIEWAWIEAYHAPEARPINPAVIAELSPDVLSKLRMSLHPSLRMVRSRYPALSIWKMNVGANTPTGVFLAAHGEDVLITRPHAQVELLTLPSGTADFLQVLRDGGSMLEATEAALAVNQRFELSTSLAWLLSAGIVVDFEVADRPCAPHLASSTS